MQDIPQVHRLVLKGQRLLERLVDALGHVVRVCGVSALQQDGELIAAQARRHVVGRAHLLAQALGHRLQQAVAKGIAQHIVHMLEAVQVQREHGQGLRRAGTGGNGLHHGVAKALPVGQARQAVPVGQAADLGLLGTNVHAHVVERARQVADLVGAVGVFQR